MSTNEVSDNFCKKYGEDAYQRIFENIIGDAEHSDVWICETHQNDAINSAGTGIYYPDGDEHGRQVSFSWSDGNNNGSTIDEFSEDRLVENTYYATVYRLRIASHVDTSTYEKAWTIAHVFNAWREEDWFKKIQAEATYDMHFCPTDKIKSHYKSMATDKGLSLEPVQIEVES